MTSEALTIDILEDKSNNVFSAIQKCDSRVQLTSARKLLDVLIDQIKIYRENSDLSDEARMVGVMTEVQDLVQLYDQKQNMFLNNSPIERRDSGSYNPPYDFMDHLPASDIEVGSEYHVHQDTTCWKLNETKKLQESSNAISQVYQTLASILNESQSTIDTVENSVERSFDYMRLTCDEIDTAVQADNSKLKIKLFLLAVCLTIFFLIYLTH